MACGLIFLAAVFDVFDGLAARALGGGTPLGAQLDSLADMVSFGVAPAYAVWTAFVTEAFSPTPTVIALGFSMGDEPVALIGIAMTLLVVGSAWRLAKFNVDTRQTSGFLGLPTPSNGLFWVSFILIVSNTAVPNYGSAQSLRWLFTGIFAQDPKVVLGVALLLAILMLSELPLPSLKFKHKGWKGNEVIFLLIGIGAMLVLLYGVLAVPLILIIYLLSPLWGKLFPTTT